VFPVTRRENILLQVNKKLNEEKDVERYSYTRCTEQVNLW